MACSSQDGISIGPHSRTLFSLCICENCNVGGRCAPCSEPLSPEFFGHRRRTSMTCATVEDSTAGLGQSLRAGCPLVGGLSFPRRLGTCACVPWHTGYWEECRPQDMRRRPMQAWVSCSGGRSTACDPDTLVGDQCVAPISSTAQQQRS